MDEDFEINEAPDAEDPDDKQEKAISSDLIRGHINTIILRALYDGDKYGYEIIAEIEGKSHGQYSLKQPTLYSALKRLEKDGYITSYWGGSVGGGRRKYFSLTDEGKTVSEQNQSEWEYSRTIIDSLISDRDFDFANPAPTAVNMRVLRDTTSRVPAREGEEDDVDFEAAFGDAEKARLEEDYAKKSAELEEAKTALEQDRARFEEEMRTRTQALEEEKSAQAELLKNEREAHENAIAEREQLVEEEHRKYEEARLEQLNELEKTREAREQELLDRERALAEERQRYDFLLAEKEARFAEAEQRHRAELEETEKRIREEQEALFRQREQQLIHQNYIILVNAPPEDAPEQTYSYYSAPAAEPQPAYEDEDYQAVVRRLYDNAVKDVPAEAPPAEEQEAQSLDGIDFRDLEARAVQDGIRITTAGGKPMKKQTESDSIVHKGKALFLSAIVVFFFCVALGSVAIALQKRLALPLFYPYFIWAAGVCLLLVTGLAYANHYGQRALRRSGLVIVNAVVIYALLVIVTLIVALGVNGDFSSISYLAKFIIFPIIFFFSVVIFGVVYYLQVRPLKRK